MKSYAGGRYFEGDEKPGNNTDTNCAIPYHARENSLPFSYGRVSKTSIPLKPTKTSSHYNSQGMLDIENNLEKYNNSNNNKLNKDIFEIADNIPNNFNYEKSAPTTSSFFLTDTTDGSMIKTQPRLTSPILVRKTLTLNNSNENKYALSRSPTHSTTNTIANTYHFRNEEKHIDNFDEFSVKGTDNKSNNDNILDKCNDLERSREWYGEPFSGVHNLSSSKSIPLPPRRQYANVTAASTIRNNREQLVQSPDNYRYNFEFNLNLNDKKNCNYAVDNLKDHLVNSVLYETHNIPLKTSNFEHNYYASNIPSEAYISNRNKCNATSTVNREKQVRVFDKTAESGNLLQYKNDLISIENEIVQKYDKQGRFPKQHVQPIYSISKKNSTEKATYIHENSKENSSQSLKLFPLNSYQSNSQNHLESNDFSVVPHTAHSSSNFLGTVQQNSLFRDEQYYPSEPFGETNGQRLNSTSMNRPETPAFPTTPHSGGYIFNKLHKTSLHDEQSYPSETVYEQNSYRLNSSQSIGNSEPQEVAAHLVKFAKDSSKFWYKPNLSREDAISLLVNAEPGTFVIRDSTTYKNSYGLVLRVAEAPPGNNRGTHDELVRHFLIEPTNRGVRLKGCVNEPVFTSLSALVYQHSINKLALPCVLQILKHDLVPPLIQPTPAQKQLLTQGAACNVLWLHSCDTESLTGEEAIRKAIRQIFEFSTLPMPTEVHFKVSQQGITLTDNTRKKFFRKHYTSDIISYCAIDPDHRLWKLQDCGNETIVGSIKKNIFAFVARCSPSSKDNQCHVFCDLSINQPASAIVSFVNKTLPIEKKNNIL